MQHNQRKPSSRFEVRRASSRQKDLDLAILPPSHRISAPELSRVLSPSHLLVDVRSAPEFNMCRIDGAVNYPIESLRGGELDKLLEEVKRAARVTFVCRRGNDSQTAARLVLDALDPDAFPPGPDMPDAVPDAPDVPDATSATAARIGDLVGGLHAWAKYVDNNFPVY